MARCSQPLRREVREKVPNVGFSKSVLMHPRPGHFLVEPQVVLDPPALAPLSGHGEIHGPAGEHEWVEEFHGSQKMRFHGDSVNASSQNDGVKVKYYLVIAYGVVYYAIRTRDKSPRALA